MPAIARAEEADDPFGPAEAISALDTPDWELGLRLSDDGRTAYFSRGPDSVPDGGTPGYSFTDLYTAPRDIHGAIGPATLLSPPSMTDERGDRNPTVTADGTMLFFDSTRTGVGIWLATRASNSGQFGPAAPIGFWGDYAEIEPYVLPDGSALYFTSAHSFVRGAPVTQNIWRAALKNGIVDRVEMSELSTRDASANERAPVVSPDESAIYYASSTDGPYRIWMATRPAPGAPFGAARSLDELNSPASADLPSYITPDACELYFVSGRTGVRDFYRAQRPKRVAQRRSPTR